MLYGQGWSWCEGIFCMVIAGQLRVGSRLYQAFRLGLRGLQEWALSPPKIFCLLVPTVPERQCREKRLINWLLSTLNFQTCVCLTFLYCLFWTYSGVVYFISILTSIIENLSYIYLLTWMELICIFAESLWAKHNLVITQGTTILRRVFILLMMPIKNRQCHSFCMLATQQGKFNIVVIVF